MYSIEMAKGGGAVAKEIKEACTYGNNNKQL